MFSTQYAGITVTLANNSKENLLALLAAIDANIPGTVRELSIQAESTNTVPVRVGDALLSSTRCGYQMLGGDQRIYGRFTQSVPLGAIYVLAAAAGQKLHVEVSL